MIQGLPPLQGVVVVGGGAPSTSVSSLAHGLIETGAASVTVLESPDGPSRPAERTCCYTQPHAPSADWAGPGRKALPGPALLSGRRAACKREQHRPVPFSPPSAHHRALILQLPEKSTAVRVG